MTAYTETVDGQTTSVSRAFDAANRLQTSMDATAGTTSYVYDGNGNLTTVYPPGADAGNPAGALSYAYDQRNLMVSHETNPDGTAWVLQAASVYDGANDRLRQDNYTSGTPVTITYSNNVVGLTQVLVAGVVETATMYEPYGEVLQQTGTSGTVYGFTGEQEDGTTGLLYLRARYYSPQRKVFQSRDPWEGTGWRPGTLNYYLYVNNNPVKLVDPSGHCSGSPGGQNSYEENLCWAKVYTIDAQWNEWWERRYGSQEQFWQLAHLESLGADFWSRQLEYYIQSEHWANRWEGLPANRQSVDGPDYYLLEVSGGPPLLWPVGASVAIVIDRYGNTYLSFGGNVGKSWLTGISGRAVAGELYDDNYWVSRGECDNIPDEGALKQHLRGFSGNIGAGALVGGGLTLPLAWDWIPAPMWEGGVYTPQIGLSVSYSFMLYDSKQ